MNYRHTINDSAFCCTVGAVGNRDRTDIMDQINARGVFAVQVLHVL